MIHYGITRAYPYPSYTTCKNRGARPTWRSSGSKHQCDHDPRLKCFQLCTISPSKTTFTTSNLLTQDEPFTIIYTFVYIYICIMVAHYTSIHIYILCKNHLDSPASQPDMPHRRCDQPLLGTPWAVISREINQRHEPKNERLSVGGPWWDLLRFATIIVL